MYAVNFGDELASAEEAIGHKRTILVGDLNMNPFDDGLVTTRGLHAVMTREIAQRPVRRVKFESNLYFYNPMWRHFGERESGHAGTYYYSSPKARADFWTSTIRCSYDLTSCRTFIRMMSGSCTTTKIRI